MLGMMVRSHQRRVDRPPACHRIVAGAHQLFHPSWGSNDPTTPRSSISQRDRYAETWRPNLRGMSLRLAEIFLHSRPIS